MAGLLSVLDKDEGEHCGAGGCDAGEGGKGREIMRWRESRREVKGGGATLNWAGATAVVGLA